MSNPRKHFVTFLSPGTFGSEVTAREIGEWSVLQALELAADIVERYSARPYGFRFSTVEFRDGGWGKHTVAQSGVHYINGCVRKREDVLAGDDERECILRSNVRVNGWGAIVETRNGYRHTAPFVDDDVVVNADGEITERARDYPEES